VAELTSTVPGALLQMYKYVQAVVAANSPFAKSGVIEGYFGKPTTHVSNNFLMVGSDETGELWTGYKQDWVGMPATVKRKGEEYTILLTARTWAGNTNGQADRLNEVWALADGLIDQVMSDPGGSGNLTASGSWQVTGVENPASGPLGRKGWGTVLAITVQVINVRIQA